MLSEDQGDQIRATPELWMKRCSSRSSQVFWNKGFSGRGSACGLTEPREGGKGFFVGLPLATRRRPPSTHQQDVLISCRVCSGILPSFISWKYKFVPYMFLLFPSCICYVEKLALI